MPLPIDVCDAGGGAPIPRPLTTLPPPNWGTLELTVTMLELVVGLGRVWLCFIRLSRKLLESADGAAAKDWLTKGAWIARFSIDCPIC